jgi:hypothetical protein
VRRTFNFTRRSGDIFAMMLAQLRGATRADPYPGRGGGR